MESATTIANGAEVVVKIGRISFRRGLVEDKKAIGLRIFYLVAFEDEHGSEAGWYEDKKVERDGQMRLSS